MDASLIVSLCQVHASPLWVLPPLKVDASNLLMGCTPTSSSYQVHSSADGVKSLLESNCEPNSAAWITPSRRPTSAAGISPLGDPDCHFAVGLTLA